MRADGETRLGASALRAGREEVLAAARAISAERLVVGSVGNVSLRLGDTVIVTPTRVPYSRMTPDDLVPVTVAGTSLGSGQRPSRELALHLGVYRDRPDVGAVIHTHSPHATAWSFLGEPLPSTEEGDYYEIGPVMTSPPAPSGSDELASAAARCLAGSAAVLLGQHGVLAAAPTLDRCLDVARVIEHQAQIAWLLRGQRPGASWGDLPRI